MQPTTRQQGFTLYELMIVVAIIAILSAIAIPSYRVFIQNNRMVADANEVSAALQTARSEAVKRGRAVVMEAKKDGTLTDFKYGWNIFVDKDGDRTFSSTADELLHTRDALRGDRSLAAQRVGTTATSTTAISKVSFNSRGYLAGRDVNFILCDDSRTGESGRQIALAFSGRIVVTKYTCA